MSDAYIGQIILFAGNFAPKNWAFCNGQMLSINSNTALFSILGTTYGGDGRTTFGLPDLRGRVPVHCGQSQGTGLSPYTLGEQTGSESVQLLPTQMPIHNHLVIASGLDATATSPSGAYPAQVNNGDTPPIAYSAYTSTAPSPPVTMNPMMVQPSGGGQPHSNIQPVLGLNYIICLYGLFPPRN